MKSVRHLAAGVALAAVATVWSAGAHAQETLTLWFTKGFYKAEDDALNAVARKAILRKTGARGLRSILEGVLLETMYELPTYEGVEEVVVNAEVIEGRAQPLVIYAERRDKGGAA